MVRLEYINLTFVFFLPLNERYGRTIIPVNGTTGTAKESKCILKVEFSLTSVVILKVLMSDVFADITKSLPQFVLLRITFSALKRRS